MLYFLVVKFAHKNLRMQSDEHTELRPCTVVKDTVSFKKYFLDLKPSKDRKGIVHSREILNYISI